MLGESHTSTTTTTTRNEQVVTSGDDSFTRERQQYTNPDGSTTTIEKRKYKAPNVTENVTINKVRFMTASERDDWTVFLVL